MYWGGTMRTQTFIDYIQAAKRYEDELVGIEMDNEDVPADRISDVEDFSAVLLFSGGQ